MTFATWNPSDKSSRIALSGGDLTATADGTANNQAVRSTQFKASGKWYCEFTCVTDGGLVGTVPTLGLANSTFDVSATQLGEDANGYGYRKSGALRHNGAQVGGGSLSWTTGDVISMLYDADADTLTFWKNGTPIADTFTGVTGSFAAIFHDVGDSVMTANFGASAFAYTPTSGFEAWEESMSDPNYNEVSLLLHFDGVDESTTFTDDGPVGHTFTPVNGANIDTAQSVFGGASGDFNASTEHIRAPTHASLNLPEDFTIEFRIRPSSVVGNSEVVGKGRGNQFFEWNVQRVGDDIYFGMGTGTSSYGIGPMIATDVLAVDTWTAVAVTRSGNDFSLYIDGTRVATLTNSDTPTVSDDSTSTLMVGGNTITGSSSHIDELRITKGVARYTGASYTLDSEAFSDEGPDPSGTGVGVFQTLDGEGNVVGGSASFSAMTAEGSPPPFGAGVFQPLDAEGANLVGTIAAGDANFAAMDGEGGAPADASGSFTAMTAEGEGSAGSSATATIYTNFRAMTATGQGSAGSVASGAGVFEAMIAEGHKPTFADVVFEQMSVEATGLTGSVASGAPAFRRLVPAIVHASEAVAVGTAQFALGTASGVGVQPTVAHGEAAFRQMRGTGSGLVGSVATGAPSFEEMLAEGTGNQPSTAIGVATFENTLARGFGSPTLTSYRTFSVNISNEAITEYQGFDFDGYAELGGRRYAVGPGGIYELAGATDNGAPIPWTFRTGMMDGSNASRSASGGLTKGDAKQLKRLEEILLSARFDGPIRVRVWTDDTTYFDYNISNFREDVVHQVRAKLGKGLRSRFYRVQLFGLNNAAAEVSRMELPFAPLKRRIG